MKIKFAIVLAVLVCLLIIRSSYGAEISIGYGYDAPVESWKTDNLECEVVQLEVSEYMRYPWYGSVLVIGMQGEANPDSAWFEHEFRDSMVIISRVGRKWQLYKNIVGRLFGGFGVLIGRLPEIGSSGIVGHFGGRLSYIIGQFEVGYEFWHLSDPFQTDSGWEIQLLVVSLNF